MLFEEFTDPVEIWYGTNGWTNEEVMVKFLHRLRAVVRRQKGNTCCVVLQVDSAGQHLTKTTLQVAARLNIILLLIPGLLTWLLQPLDVFVFALLKKDFRENASREKKRQPEGKLPHNAWIRCLRASVEKYLLRATWVDTFERVGLADHAEGFTAFCAMYLTSPNQVPARELTALEVDGIIGKHRVDIQRLLFSTASRLRTAHLQAIAGPLPAHLEDWQLPLEG